MITLTNIVYQGNGYTATFDDGSVANGQFVVVNGVLTVLGVTPAQEAAIGIFNTNIDIPDSRYGDLTIATHATTDHTGIPGVAGGGGGGGGGYSFRSSGLIATGAGAATVETLTIGKDYAVFLFCSDFDGANFVASDIADGSVDLFAITGGTTLRYALNTYSLGAPGSQDASSRFEMVEAGPGATFVTLGAFDGQDADTVDLLVRANGDIIVSHNNGGNNTNGAWLIMER
jgi:hypothetical protein